MTYPESLASQWPGDECSSESPLPSSTLIKAKKRKCFSSACSLCLQQKYNTENFASRYYSCLLILIYKSLLFMAQVLERYLLLQGPPRWKRAGESLSQFVQLEAGQSQRDFHILFLCRTQTCQPQQQRSQSLLLQWGRWCGWIIPAFKGA